MQDSSKQPGFTKWPTPADKLWIHFKSVLTVFEPPIPCVKYKLNRDTVSMIENLFARHQANMKLNCLKVLLLIDDRFKQQNWPYSNTDDMRVTNE